MTTYGPDFNGVVRSVPDRSSAEPENQPEALDRELSRLIGEYMDDDAGDSMKEEAWNMIADFTVDNARTIIATLSSLPEAPAVPVVKALEWEPDRTGWRAYSIVGMYNVLNGQWWRLNKAYRSPEMRDDDAAKAAAQADFETRIRSALQSSPPVKAAAVDGVREPEMAALLEAFEPVLDESIRDYHPEEVMACWRALSDALASQAAVEGKAVAWQWRSLNKEGEWSIWTELSEDTAASKMSENRTDIQVRPLYASPRPAAADAGVREASEDELCKLLVKIWGYKWVEFEDIPPPGDHGRDNIGEAYSVRLNAQDAVRGLLRRYSILSFTAKRGQTE